MAFLMTPMIAIKTPPPTADLAMSPIVPVLCSRPVAPKSCPPKPPPTIPTSVLPIGPRLNCFKIAPAMFAADSAADQAHDHLHYGSAHVALHSN
jgi:hypothetical protein